MLVDGRQRVQSKFRRIEGKLVWFGRVNGRVVRPGTYEIRLRAVDRAGNRSVRTRAVPVRVRFVELSRDRIEVGAGKRFSVRVLTDAQSYRWLFAGRRGVGRREVLVLRAPEEPGSYTLYVSVGGRAARAEVDVTAPEVTGPPLILLGVSRSGTTLLRVILDRSPGIAIPDESFFVPLLARRHGRTVDAERFLDDVARIPTIREWGVSLADVAARVDSGMPTGEAIAAIYEVYAAAAGKPRWGDKTPMYMRHLPLLEELFPDRPVRPSDP